MTAKPEGPHFSLVWFVVIALAILATLPLDVLGWYPHWHYWAPMFAISGFSMFFAAETAAGDAAPGTAGTMTNWAFRQIQSDAPRLKVTSWATLVEVVRNNWQRMLVAAWLSGLIAWRINWPLGAVWVLWLVPHYSGIGAGPMDRLFTWLGHRFGRNIRTY